MDERKEVVRESDAAFVERMKSPYGYFVAESCGLKECGVEWDRLIALASRAVEPEETKLSVNIIVTDYANTSCRISVPKGMNFDTALEHVYQARKALGKELVNFYKCPVYRNQIEARAALAAAPRGDYAAGLLAEAAQIIDQVWPCGSDEMRSKQGVEKWKADNERLVFAPARDWLRRYRAEALRAPAEPRDEGWQPIEPVLNSGISEVKFNAGVHWKCTDGEALAPIEQAIHWLEQKRSFVRSETGRPNALSTTPEYVILDAYLALIEKGGDATVNGTSRPDTGADDNGGNAPTPQPCREPHLYDTGNCKWPDCTCWPDVTNEEPWKTGPGMMARRVYSERGWEIATCAYAAEAKRVVEDHNRLVAAVRRSRHLGKLEGLREAAEIASGFAGNLIPNGPKHVRGLRGSDVADAINAAASRLEGRQG